MSAAAHAVEQATIQQYCKALRTPTIGAQFVALAEQAQREDHTYTRYLEALLAMEVEEREHGGSPDSRRASASHEDARRL